MWQLYDTFGFPVDLTRLMAEERGLRVDEATFVAAKEKSIAASKKDSAPDGIPDIRLDVHDLGKLEKSDLVQKTHDDAKYCEIQMGF